MSKSPYTLKEDIEHVLTTGEGYTKEISEWVAWDIAQSLQRQLGRDPRSTRKGTLRVSNLGTPCERKLWYTVNIPYNGKSLSASALNKFIFGDLTESHMLGLAMAAGHEVTGLQDQLDVDGIRGSRDCVIDGMLFDVKSASTNAFSKFKDNSLLRDGNDPFGYLSQLSSYLYGSRHDDLVTYKRHAGFLVMDKQFGHISLDIYDLTEQVANKPKEVKHKKAMVKKNTPPERAFEDVEMGRSGNRKLGINCSYCEFNKVCWPDVRTFIYSNGPVYLTKVEKVPNVPEVDH